MDGRLLSFISLLLLAGIFHTATTSIGIQCSVEAVNYNTNHPYNYTFLISQLVSAVFIMSMALVGMYLAVTDKSS